MNISSVDPLTADRVDVAAGVQVIESLKKRRRWVYRPVPVRPALLDARDLVHGIRELHSSRGRGWDARPLGVAGPATDVTYGTPGDIQL